MDSISILGCGWLGLPLAQQLKEKGYDVKGSVRSIDHLSLLEEKSITGYYLNINPYVVGKDIKGFLSSDILIINFPPQRRDDIEKYHQAQFENLIKELRLSPIKNVLFVSSTSVYPANNNEVVEEDAVSPGKPSGRALLRVERLLLSEKGFKTTVLRFGGLIGYDRKPGRFLSGKKKLTGGDSPVNLIHRDDCIGVIEAIISGGPWGEVFNACSDIHPKRKDYYIQQAKLGGFEAPEFEPGQPGPYKLINSAKLKRLTGYDFKYPDPSLIVD